MGEYVKHKTVGVKEWRKAIQDWQVRPYVSKNGGPVKIIGASKRKELFGRAKASHK